MSHEYEVEIDEVTLSEAETLVRMQDGISTFGMSRFGFAFPHRAVLRRNLAAMLSLERCNRVFFCNLL